MAYTDGYEKVPTGGEKPPYSSQGTEEGNQAKAPRELEWADRPKKSDPGYT